MSGTAQDRRRPLMTAIRYSAGGHVDAVDIDWTTQEVWDAEIRRWMDGADTVTYSRHPFAAPFLLAVDHQGRFRQAPSALIVDPASPTGINTLFGPALFFRSRKDGNVASVQPGDADLVRALPLWIRFDRLGRGPRIPTAEELEAAGGTWAPQIQVALSVSRRSQEVFVNALIARFEFDVQAYQVTDQHVVELMLSPGTVDEARRFIAAAIGDDGQLIGAWAED